ncbi:alpha-galactosidase, partial [Streptomyces sp. NPDC052127]
MGPSVGVTWAGRGRRGVDDGWFGARTGDHAGLGDWQPNPDRFPNGLKP